MVGNPNSSQHSSLAGIEIAMLGSSAPDWVHLLPDGVIRAADGRHWNNSEPQQVIDASMSSIDLVIDYEHQSNHAKVNGVKAPAAGWIKSLALRKDGIWGRVEWVGIAAQHIQSKEYRYISPTFIHNKSGYIQKIVGAALVNKPAIHELTALANNQADGPTLTAMERSICQRLGVSEEAFSVIKKSNQTRTP